MSISTDKFRPVFDRVCEEFDVTGVTKKVAWNSCFTTDVNGSDYLDGSVVRIYRLLDRTRGPWIPTE